jgi:hypothetical protein
MQNPAARACRSVYAENIQDCSCTLYSASESANLQELLVCPPPSPAPSKSCKENPAGSGLDEELDRGSCRYQLSVYPALDFPSKMRAGEIGTVKVVRKSKVVWVGCFGKRLISTG